jgi:hypothetical protein
VLTEGGTAQLLANWLHVRGEDWRERVASWLSGLGCDAWVVQREATDPAGYAEMWLRDSGEVALPDYEERYEEWSRSFDDRKVEAIGFGVISLRRTDAAHPAVRLEDLRHDIGGSLGPVGAIVAAELGQMATAQSLSPDEVLLSARLSAVPDVRLEQVAAPSAEGWEVATQTLVRTSGVGRRVVADAVLADLVAGCTGDAELGQVLAVLAAAYDVPTHELAAHALPAVHELLGYGFLRPAV